MVKHDDYMTPFSAWKDVSPYIPRHLTLWEAFYGDGTSGAHLTELGFDVIHEDVDFFEHDLGECVVTNPPFSELPRVLARLRELGKPFVVIMPCSTLTTRYFRDLFPDIRIPRISWSFFNASKIFYDQSYSWLGTTAAVSINTFVIPSYEGNKYELNKCYFYVRG